MNLISQYIINPKIKEVYFKSKSCDYRRKKSSSKRLRLSIITRSNIHNEFQHITRFKIRNVSFNMIKCPLGVCDIGSDRFDYLNMPPRKVMFDNHLLIGETEVTQELFKSVVKINPSYYQEVRGYKNSNQRPVENVSWYLAVLFCNNLSQNLGRKPYYNIEIVKGKVKITSNEKDSNGFRLPHENEWEYAARAGTSNQWSGTNEPNELDQIAWTPQNTNNVTHEVKKKKPNEWGIYDMTGNVWELCDNDETLSEKQWPTCTIKGGGVDQKEYMSEFSAWYVTNDRNKNEPLGSRQTTLGFRIVLSSGRTHLVVKQNENNMF
jgi:formylglycine-generating enzyme required for sulfatase activity